MDKSAKIFADICEGSSMVYIDGLLAFLKHPDSKMEGDSIIQYEKILEETKSRGAMTDEEAEKLIKENGDWKKEDDSAVADLKQQIEEKQNLKKGLKYPSQLAGVERKIKELSQELFKKEHEKRELMGLTAEIIAQSKANDGLIVSSLYKDRECKIKLFSPEDLEEINRDKISNLMVIYNESMRSFSDEILQTFVLSDFFSPYFQICEDPQSFFGKPAIFLTRMQLSLIFYTRVFKNIFENVPNIPDKIRKDPVSLLEFSSNHRIQQENESKGRSGANNNSTGKVLFGATKDDVNVLAGHDENVVDLNQEIVKRGGGATDMSLNDFLKTGM